MIVTPWTHIYPCIRVRNTNSEALLSQFQDVIATIFKLSGAAKVWEPSNRIFEASLAIDRDYFNPGIICQGSPYEKARVISAWNQDWLEFWNIETLSPGFSTHFRRI